MKRLLAGALSVALFFSVLAGSVGAAKPPCKPAWACPQPTSTPSVTPTPAPTASPTPTPVAGFTSIFRDDFTTPVAEGQFPAAVSAKWSAYPWGWKDTSGNGSYDPSIISIHDGLMDIFIRTTGGVHRVANPLPKLLGGLGWEQNHQLYGRYEVRARADSMHGYKGAWLQWPMSDTHPRDGEIDFPEADFDATISAFMHRQDGTSGSDQDAYSSTARWQDWHTYVLEWTPTRCEFFIDGVSIGKSTARIPNTPMGWRIQNETTLDGIVPADSVQGHVLVDYVEVWRYG